MNLNYLERRYHLRTSDFDMRSRIFPSSVLDLFQDTAGEHAAALGIGYRDLSTKKLCWMLARVAYRVIKQPRLFSDVVVKTWPIESRRVEFDRDYAVYDESGELLIVGSSQWVVLDVTDRESPRIVPARDFGMGLDEYITERAMEKPFVRIAPSFETEDEAYFTQSSYTDIDTNGHVNNIRYSSFVLNALDLPPEKEITSFRLDFIKEILDGAPIKITHRTDDKIILCRGESDGGSGFATSFIARLEIK